MTAHHLHHPAKAPRGRQAAYPERAVSEESRVLAANPRCHDQGQRAAKAELDQ